jgi:arabinose-5-phosphate isomerase
LKTEEILSLARKTFSIEIQELEKTKNSLNENFIQAVEKIYETKGKLVVVGIGKVLTLPTR